MGIWNYIPSVTESHRITTSTVIKSRRWVLLDILCHLHLDILHHLVLLILYSQQEHLLLHHSDREPQQQHKHHAFFFFFLSAPYLFSATLNNNTTTTPSSLPQQQQQTQASVQINAEKDTNQEYSKPDDQEQSKAKIPSIQQTKTVGNFQSVKQELKLKARETNGTDMVTELFKESGSDSLNIAFKLSLGELSDGEEIVDAKDTEGSKKSERFENTRILRGITQTPHYIPLQCYSKLARDKLIVVWDEIFEETIDQIQRLTTEIFSSNVKELWKTMAELKDMGYNVARLENQMEDLADVINRRKTSQTEITDLRAKAEDYKEQKKKMEKEIADLQAQADNAQVMVNDLMDQVDKMEGNLPVFDALFESVAVNPF